ncbi:MULTISPECIES: AraC family transcriptional regulator [Parabacteroides]|uniref:helix-turn-helix domain-containing protein n=1 Tax=Parabacteroides leei TaxID=2939491 RepID=UPI001E3818FD|nr:MULTISPECIES: AraC family transcriptional regulator [Parabacteroides]MCL3850108.1 AraC family transcriptional regulator [Parabacteroides leei]
MSGSVKIYFRKKELKTINELHMFYLKKQEDYIFEIETDANILVFSFESVLVQELAMFQTICRFGIEQNSNIQVLSIVEPLYSFLQLISQYLKKEIYDYILFETKQKELFHILKTFYRKDEMAGFFGMLTDATSVFKAQIFNNYMKVKTINELASLLGYGVTTFRVKFKEQFGVSAYRWILNQKSKQIIYNMTVEGDGFAKIIDDFDFSSYSHFNKFCKSQYGYTPGELRKRLNIMD